jgi:hypothetical protein
MAGERVHVNLPTWMVRWWNDVRRRIIKAPEIEQG